MRLLPKGPIIPRMSQAAAFDQPRFIALIEDAMEDVDTVFEEWFGPEDLAMEGRIHKDGFNLLAGMVRCIEMLLRRMLILAAAALDVSPSKPRSGQHKPSAPKPFVLDDATTWRVRFKLYDADPQRPRSSGRRRKLPDRDVYASTQPGTDAHLAMKQAFFEAATRPVLGLAKRIEAIRRIINNVPRAALRAARTLQRVHARLKSNKPPYIRLDAYPWTRKPPWLDAEIEELDAPAERTLLAVKPRDTS